MVEEDLNNRVTSFGDKTNFSIIHFNTRSLMRNFDQLNLLLRNLNMPFSVIGGKNIIVGCVYRPPNQNAAMFIDKFNNILSLISKGNKHCLTNREALTVLCSVIKHAGSG